MGEEAVEVGRDEMVRGPRAQASSGLYAEAGENHWGMVMKVIDLPSPQAWGTPWRLGQQRTASLHPGGGRAGSPEPPPPTQG